MRVVVDGTVYGFNRYGGINEYFNEVLPRLVQQHQVQVDLLVRRKCVGELPRGGVRVRFGECAAQKTGLSWKLDSLVIPKAVQALNAVLREAHVKLGPRCVFQSTYFTWVHSRTPQVATAYDMNHELFPELYESDWGMWLRKQYRTYLKRATRILAISQKTKKDIVDVYGIDEDMIDVVHLAASYDVFHPSGASLNGANGTKTNSDREPYLLFVGMRGSYKNFRYTLHALRRLSNMRLVVAGSEWRSQELELIESLGLKERVSLVVHPNREALRDLYCNSHAFVFPSLHEGFGLPLLEAMACGTVLLASDTEIFREIAGPAALYFDPYEPDSLCAVVESISNAALRDKHIELGLQQAAKYSWDRCAKETLAVYQKALDA